MNTVRLYDTIECSARAGLVLQSEDGSMPAGWNGPYADPETPVRNTSHWIITFLKAYDISHDKLFLEAANKACDYLLTKEARPMDSVFWCRKKPEKDFSNGLIGQAWVIESLAAAAEPLGRPELYALAEQVFLMHPWDENVCAWRCLNVDGSIKGFDGTFNHQLWFAAAGSLLRNTSEAIDRAKAFTERLPRNVWLYRDGIIRHNNPFFLIRDCRSYLLSLLRLAKADIRGASGEIYSKSVGYHGFNLYGLAMLRTSFPDMPFWTSRKLFRMLRCTRRGAFVAALKASKYSFPYNPPGIEIAFALEKFGAGVEDQIILWLKRQFEATYDDKSGLMNRGAADPANSAARLYEATRLENYTIQVDS